jgi:hypothetical protein
MIDVVLNYTFSELQFHPNNVPSRYIKRNFYVRILNIHPTQPNLSDSANGQC